MQTKVWWYFIAGICPSIIYFVVPLIATKVLPIIMLSLICSLEGTKYSKFIVGGILFSSLGDIFLELNSSKVDFFTIGLVAFLCAHLCYIKAFWMCDIQFRLNIFIATVIGGVIFYTCMMYFLVQSVSVALIGPVLLYGLVLCTMTILAINKYICGSALEIRSNNPLTNDMFSCIGAVVFAVSDSILSLDTFYTPIPNANVAIMITYYIGQMFIAASCYHIKSDCDGLSDEVDAANRPFIGNTVNTQYV